MASYNAQLAVLESGITAPQQENLISSKEEDVDSDWESRMGHTRLGLVGLTLRITGWQRSAAKLPV